MRRIVVTVVGLCVVVGCVTAFVHAQDQPLADRIKALQVSNQKKANAPAAFQPEDSRPVPTAQVPASQPGTMRSVLKKKPDSQRTSADKPGFVSRSLQDYPSSRRTARRPDRPTFTRPQDNSKQTPAPAAPITQTQAPNKGTPTPVRKDDRNSSYSPSGPYRPGSSGPVRPGPTNQGTAVAPRQVPTAPATSTPARIRPNKPAYKLSSQLPNLRLDVEGPSEIRYGKPAQYRIHLNNVGRTAADSIFVRIQIPAWVDIAGQKTSHGAIQQGNEGPGERQLIWDVQQLNAGKAETLMLDLAPTKDQEFKLKVDWAVRPESMESTVRVLRPALQLAINGPTDLEFGQSGVFAITLRNPGNGDAENIILNIQPGGAQPRKIARLGAGEKMDMEVELTARQAGMMSIRATAIADDGLRAESSQKVQVRRAQLQVRTVAPPLVFAGSVAKLRVEVVNNGDAVARNVTASAQLPNGGKYVAGVGGATAQSGRLTWAIGDLPPGNRRSFEVDCQLMSPGKGHFVVRLVDQQGNAANHSSVTQVEALADLKLTVNDPPGPKAVGDLVPYEIVITNRGTKAANSVNLVTHFSKGIEPVRIQGAVGEIRTGQVAFQKISRIEPGQKLRIVIMAKATRAGGHQIRAELECQDPETSLLSQETTRFYGSAATGSSSAGSSTSGPSTTGSSTTGSTGSTRTAGQPTLAN